MQALIYREFGPPSVLRLEETPPPLAKTGELLVRVHAASLNPSDLAIVAGRLGRPELPSTPGRDLAGVVVAPEARRGEEVWAASGPLAQRIPGSHAELVILPAELARPKPAGLGMAEAAAAALAYMTAAAALLRVARLRPNETVLITGAAGAVGGAALRIARWQGARTIALDRQPPKEGDLRLAATGDWPARVAEFTGGAGADLALDCVGGPLFEPVLKSLGQRGRQVAIASPGQPRVEFNLVDFYHHNLALHGLDTLALDAATCGDLLDALRPGFESGALRPPEIARRIPLAQAPDAFAALASGHTSGKVVLTMV